MDDQLKKAVGLLKQKKYGEAVSLLEAVVKSTPRHQLALQFLAEAYKQTENISKSAHYFKASALAGGKHSAQSWYNAGVMYQRINDFNEAVSCYKNSLEFAPDYLPTRNNLAIVLQNSSRTKEALPHARWLLDNATTPEHIINSGYILRANEYYDDADRAFKKALALDPENRRSISAAIQSAQYVCDWQIIDRLIEKILNEDYRAERVEETRELHHVHLAWCDDENLNYQVAKILTSRHMDGLHPLYQHSKRPLNKKLKIGYVSSDFFNHATLHLMAGVFENHDKSLFEIYGYCHSNQDNSIYRKRFINSIDHLRDIRKLTDEDAAKLIFDDGIDILVDLKGFTDKNRLRIFALKPAPIQVTYIGFPGTSGAEFFDYVITDKYVTPNSSRRYYSEKLCRLPESYQCNDNLRIIASNELSKNEYGLPTNSFVFCCFNSTYKIDKEFFHAWVEILKKVENSVLWILNPGRDALVRMHDVMTEGGISTDRLILAEKENPPIHLRRLELFANLALDTHIVNGHTTTSDALWAGVPVIAVTGNHFNSRVSTSLLNAIGLPELAVSSTKEYVDLAVSLATDRHRMISVREKLERNRLSYPLFDSERFTRHLELAFMEMSRNYSNGISAEIDVAKLPERKIPFQSEINRKKVNRRVVTDAINVDLLSKYFISNGACPLCNSLDVRKSTESLVRIKPEDKEQEVAVDWFMCTECAHHFRSNCLTNINLIDEKSTAFLPAIDRECAHQILDNIKKCLNGLAATPIKILSVYPGDVNIIATGVEFGFGMSAVVKSNQLESFKRVTPAVIAGEFLNLHFSGLADVIYLGRTLEMAQSPKSILEKSISILNKNGVVALIFTNAGSHSWQTTDFEIKQEFVNNPLANHLYRLKSIESLMTGYDFRLIDARPFQQIESGVLALFQRN